MTQQARTIVVFGATGQQGSEVVNALQASGGWRLRAFTRNTESEKAQALKRQGVEVVRGSWDEPVSLDAALRGAYGAFAVSTAVGSTVEDEVREGKNVADAAKRANLQHFVFTSVCGAERKTDVPGFESKTLIEAHVRSLGLPYTFIRPVSFMENFHRNKDAIMSGRLNGLLKPSTFNWYIATRDIGAFAAAAFTNRSKFLGEAINIAGEQTTMSGVVETFSRVLGRPVAYVPMPREEAVKRVPPGMLAMNDWFEREGYKEDVPALRARWGIPLMGLEEWVRRAGWTTKPS